MSIGVANNLAGSGPNAAVNVSLATDWALEVIGEPARQARIAEGSEGSVRFRVRGRDELGAANLTFVARSGASSATRRIDLSVRPATAYMTRLQADMLPRGEREIPLDRDLYPHHRTLETGVSMLPLQFAHGFTSYLSEYPYQCTEQIVSQAMPAVLRGSRPEFGYVRSRPGADMSALVGELRARQNDAGAYRSWPGGDQVEQFVSLYAQHVLVEAGERGQPEPSDLIDSAISYLRSIATRDGDSLREERDSAYAIYLLTRQGQRMSAEAAALRQRLEERYRGKWEQDIAAA